MCGHCLKFSKTFVAGTPGDAWAKLQGVGWSQGSAYALCPKCARDLRPNVPGRKPRA
jgi:hypothetical protein